MTASISRLAHSPHSSRSKLAKEARKKRCPVGAARAARGAGGQVGDAAVSQRKDKETHALAAAGDRIVKLIKGRGALPKAGSGRWRATPRPAAPSADQLLPTFQPPGPGLPPSWLVHPLAPAAPRTDAPAARFATNERHRRTTATDRNRSFARSHSWCVLQFAHPTTSPCSVAFTSWNVPAPVRATQLRPGTDWRSCVDVFPADQSPNVSMLFAGRVTVTPTTGNACSYQIPRDVVLVLDFWCS